MKKLVLFVLVAMLASFGCDTDDTASQPSETIFFDAQLDSVVRMVIHKPTGPLSVSDVDTVTWIWTVYPFFEYFGPIYHVSNLKGIEHLTQLRVLLLQPGRVKDLSPLAGLTQLEQLRLQEHSVSDLTPLSGLSNLWSLALTNNNVVDLGPLRGLASLKHLGIGSNAVRSLDCLSGMQALEGIGASYNYIRDLSGLRDLPALRSLDLAGNQIEDIGPLLDLTDWGRDCFLHLQNNPLNEVSINEYIPALEAQGVNVTY